MKVGKGGYKIRLSRDLLPFLEEEMKRRGKKTKANCLDDILRDHFGINEEANEEEENNEGGEHMGEEAIQEIKKELGRMGERLERIDSAINALAEKLRFDAIEQKLEELKNQDIKEAIDQAQIIDEFVESVKAGKPSDPDALQEIVDDFLRRMKEKGYELRKVEVEEGPFIEYSDEPFEGAEWNPDTKRYEEVVI